MVLHVWDHGCERVTVIGIAGHRLDMGDELAALAVLEGGGNSSHPVGKSGLNRRTGMQRSQHGD